VGRNTAISSTGSSTTPTQCRRQVLNAVMSPRAQDDVPVLEDEAQPAVEHEQPDVPLVAAGHRIAQAGRKDELVRAQVVRALAAERQPDLAVASGPGLDRGRASEELGQPRLERRREGGEPAQAEAAGARLEPADGRSPRRRRSCGPTSSARWGCSASRTRRRADRGR
jgi:hypothetical protein